MLFLLQLVIIALFSMFFGAYIIGIILYALVSNVGSNRKKDIIKIILFSICILFVFGIGSYLDIFIDFKRKPGEDYLMPCLAYSIVILVSSTIFYNHKGNKRSNFLREHFGDFRPTIPLLKNTGYIFTIFFILESLFRIFNRNSLIQCYWIFKNYLPTTFEEKLKYTPAIECSYFILVLSSICLLCMIYSDWRTNRNNCIKSLIIASIVELLIFAPINAYRYYNYYIPTNYNVNNNILKNSDIELLKNDIDDNVFDGKVSSLGNINLGESCQKVDRDIKKYINSIEKDSIAYIFDNTTFVRCISCMFDDNNELQVISLKLQNLKFNEHYSDSQFGHKFVTNRDYALVKKDEFVRMDFNMDIADDGHTMYDYLYVTRPYDNKYWESAIATISKKYGDPLYVGTELNGKFSFEGKRTYYWIADAKIIKFHIYRDSAACLSYIKSSFILDIIQDREQKEMEEKDLYNNMIIEEEQNRLQDSIEKVTKEKKNELNKIEISNKTFEDI